VGVHLAGEHAGELQGRHALVERRRVPLQLGEAGGVLFRFDEVDQLARVGDTLGDSLQLDDGALEPGTLPAQFLGALGGVPDAGVLQFAVYLFEPLALAVVLKDTPSARRGADRGP